MVLELQALVGAQLQLCQQSESGFGLGFYHLGETIWLWMDLDPEFPVLIRFRGTPPRLKKISRPLALFIKSRFCGRRLKAVVFEESKGRVVELCFHRPLAEDDTPRAEGGESRIELRLFPHGQNVIATDGKASVAELKPKPLELAPRTATDSPRSWDEVEALWRAKVFPKESQIDGPKEKPTSVLHAPDADVTATERWKKAIAKKELALERMRAELMLKSSSVEAEAGEWIKAHRSLDVPLKFETVIDRRRPLAWNIEECFRRAKQNQRKLAGAKERIAKVEGELKRLQGAGPSELSRTQQARPSLFDRSQARGRRHIVSDELEVAIGKSAADNMALLRKARPFDYWLHLREQPGSHGFLRREKNRVVSDQELIEAGVWVIEQSTGKRRAELKDIAFDLLIVECRYVRPIRGALGQVTYTHDRVIRIRL